MIDKNIETARCVWSECIEEDGFNPETEANMQRCANCSGKWAEALKRECVEYCIIIYGEVTDDYFKMRKRTRR
jgi:hypothetical protein